MAEPRSKQIIDPNLYALILAGGSGTRFWPASRQNLPKQLLSIGPDPEQSLIAASVRRIAPLCPPERVLIATSLHLLEATRKELPWLPEQAFLGEPVSRNTAACIGWASAIIERREPDAMVMVLPSDHHIEDEPGLIRCMRDALVSAADGAITTIGIQPSRPETGYGYIEAGEEIRPRVCRVARFVEKPDRANAERYVASGRYFWNSGMFFFRVRDMLASIREHMPDLARGLERIARAAADGAEAERAETRGVFETLAAVSIDHGIIEKTSPLNVVLGDFGWSDLGSWQSAWELGSKDSAGNCAHENAILIDARGNLVKDLRGGNAERVIALVGVSDLCVIQTDDALLVIPRERSQDVRLIVKALQDKGLSKKL